MPGKAKALPLAVLFVGSGLLTYQIYYWVAKIGNDDTQLFYQLLTGLPFGIACSLRFMRPSKWAIPAVVLDCVTWVVAYRVTLAASGANVFLGAELGGFLGGLGVTAATGLGCRSLYTFRTLGVGALLGGLAALPFSLVLNGSEHEAMILAFAFPLWQVIVGIWINAAQR